MFCRNFSRIYLRSYFSHIFSVPLLHPLVTLFSDGQLDASALWQAHIRLVALANHEDVGHASGKSVSRRVLKAKTNGLGILTNNIGCSLTSKKNQTSS